MSPVHAIIFDLDGTLIDSVPDIASAVNAALSGVGCPTLPDVKIAGYVGHGLRQLLEDCLGPLATEEKLDKGEKLFGEHYRKHCLDRTTVYPGVKETLSSLNGRPMAVVSNKPEAFVLQILKGLNLAGDFEAILGEEAIPFQKPRPEPLWEAAKRLGNRPETTLMVGDSPIDIRAGKAAGMATCAVSYGLTKKELLESEKPDHLIDRFSQLKDIIQ